MAYSYRNPIIPGFHPDPSAEYKEAGIGSTAGLSTEGTRNMTFTGTFIGLFSVRGSADFKEFKMVNRDGN